MRASPAARKLAAEIGIEVAGLTGSGPRGAILRADVEAAHRPASRTEATPAQPKGAGFEPMRAAIAAAISRSKREIPHYYLAHGIDVAAARDRLTEVTASRPPEQRLLLGALFIKATALGIRRFPEFNGFFAEGSFRPSPALHAGVAVTIRGGGLVAPAIHDTADLDLDTLMARMRDLVARVRAGRFRGSEIADPTIAVSSLGERGVETLFGVIYPPQVAIVGFGKAIDRPKVSEGRVVPRPTVTLAADHRASDGHRGVLFLAEVDRLLQRPVAL